jgi:phage terminase large subunit GpA-like protein
VRAFGDAKTSALVDWGYCPKIGAAAPADEDSLVNDGETLASDLKQLDSVILNRRWDVDGENPLGYSSLSVRLLGIDRGYRQTDTDTFVKNHPGGRVVAVYGDPKIVPGTLYRPMRAERNARTGRIYDEGVECWGIETGAYKTEIASRWIADRRQPGVWWLPSDILTTDGGEDYLRQITSEQRKTELLHGRKITRWELISNDLANHDWDCEVYANAMADMIVGRDWDASRWPWLTDSRRQGAKGANRGGPVTASDAVAVREFSQEDFSAR